MLTLVCGLPNAGKTTGYPDALHQDEIGTTENVCAAISRIDGDATIEGCFPTARCRRRVREAYRGAARCVFIDISVEESIRRERRNRPAGVLRNAARFFEPPTYDEGWDEIIRIGGNE